MSKTSPYVEVLLPLAAPGTYTYRKPKGISYDELKGRRVAVVFGQGEKLYTGLVVAEGPDEVDFEAREIDEVLDDHELVNDQSLKLWRWMAEYYMCHPGEVLNTALPTVLNLSEESRFALNTLSQLEFGGLSKGEQAILNYLESNRDINLSEVRKIAGLKNPMPLLRKLLEKEVLSVEKELKRKYSPKTVPWVALNDSYGSNDKLNELIQSLSRAPAQQEVLMKFLENAGLDDSLSNLRIPKKDLLVQSGVSDGVLKALVQKGVFDIAYLVESRLTNEGLEKVELKALNDEQTACMNEIKKLFKDKDVVLLRGVTSSGKTEIYAHLIEEAIQRGEQVLYLLPEISLTSQLIGRLRKYFGNDIGLYHSRLSGNEKAEVWRSVNGSGKNSMSIVLGARSSIFLPFQKLGLIIVDEEHDRSFKQQDPAPRYEARDAAAVLAKIHKCKALLGSATPSLESIENARTGKYGYVQLLKRFGGFEMPELQAVDLSEEYRKRRMQGSFSNLLVQDISEKLHTGEQVILFQNRRGYAPLVICESCSHSPKCKNCDVTLTHHKKWSALICHYCGYRISMTTRCPDCGKGPLKDRGMGTERIEEELQDLFPSARIARFDLDSTRKKNAFQELLDDFEAKKIDVLIGTQMVTKGLDFENVGLVGIINADNMLRFPDFRSFERTFQMLTQVSGRAGRKKKRGMVIIQTFDPWHPVIQFVLTGNYKGFVQQEIEERKLFHYPPFYRMIDVRLKHRDRQKLYDASGVFGQVLKKAFGAQLLGPEFHYIERIRNLYSMHFMLKVSKNASISSTKKKLSAILAEYATKDNFKSIRFQIDVDPY